MKRKIAFVTGASRAIGAESAIAGVVAWLADNEPSAQWRSEDTLRGPAIAKQLGLLDSASFFGEPR